jgi:hypothetical protein
MSFLYPVRRRVFAALSPDRQRELAVWSRNHARIFDLRYHSIRTCPYLAYSPAYVFLRGNAPEWAAWLHRFYRHKHEEEGHCTCVAELAGVKP